MWLLLGLFRQVTGKNELKTIFKDVANNKLEQNFPLMVAILSKMCIMYVYVDFFNCNKLFLFFWFLTLVYGNLKLKKTCKRCDSLWWATYIKN